MLFTILLCSIASLVVVASSFPIFLSRPLLGRRCHQGSRRKAKGRSFAALRQHPCSPDPIPVNKFLPFSSSPSLFISSSISVFVRWLIFFVVPFWVRFRFALRLSKGLRKSWEHGLNRLPFEFFFLTRLMIWECYDLRPVFRMIIIFSCAVNMTDGVHRATWSGDASQVQVQRRGPLPGSEVHLATLLDPLRDVFPSLDAVSSLLHLVIVIYLLRT